MDLLPVLYLAAYVGSICTVVALLYALLVKSRRTETSLSATRLLRLTKDEFERLKTLDPVFIMHLSIALGVSLSILTALLDPFLYLVPALRIVILILSVPLIIGLVAALGWRVQRYSESKRVEREILHTDQGFTSASSWLQVVLILAIGFTTTELVLDWIPTLAVVDIGLGIIRNVLVIGYYADPSVNLLHSFDRPLSAVRLPFKLSDVMDGKVDPAEIKVGAEELSDFERFEKMSYHSCVEIGACESACPATAAERSLSPRILVRKLELLNREEGEKANPLSSITQDELWSCTSCGACVNGCPVAVKHVDLIYDMRRTVVGQGKLDKEKSSLLQNLTQTQNPYGLDSRSRADWAKEEGIDTLSTNPDAEYLYWVGCVSSFDQRAQSIARSLARILRSAELSFAILGSEEACTGDPARRVGEEGRYQELAYQNIQRLNGYGVKKVITTCPHCFNSIKNEYPAFGGDYEVIHHTQLISDLISQGKIKVTPDKIKEVSATLHDACYAARYNNIFEEPRKVLGATGVELREMHRNKKKTFCCGAGGSNYWYKVPQKKSISQIRTEEARGTGASTIATECPFCLSMFEDSTKVSGTQMAVRDVAEIVAEAISAPAPEPS